MSKKYEHDGNTYWITVEPAVHDTTKQQGFIAYVSDKEPGGLFYGSTVKNGSGQTIFFETELSAITNANAVKKSELDSKLKD